MTAIGQSVLRLEDPPLLTGRGCFVADLSFPHQLHMRVLRSARAHGRTRIIDTAAALAAPGVVAVWTPRDVSDLPPIGLRGGIGTSQADVARLTPYLQPVLARERVRYIGESVAAVFAEDSYVAEDAADLITVEIEEFYEHASEGKVGLQVDTDQGTLNLGAQGSRRRLTSRKIILKGWPGEATPADAAVSAAADGAAAVPKPK